MFRAFVLSALLLGAGGAVAQEVTGQFYLGVSGIGGYVLPPTGTDGFAFAAPDVFAGYNVMAGNVLLGIEASLSGDLTSDHLSVSEGHYQAPASVFVGPGFSGSGTPPFGVPSTPGTHHAQWDVAEDISYDLKYSDQLKTSFGGSISARVGIETPDALLYARVGGGLARVHRLTTNTFSNITVCEAIGVDVTVGAGGGYTTEKTGCEEQFTRESAETVFIDRKQTVPTILLGVGAEKTWDRFFARGELSMQHAFYSDDDDSASPNWPPVRAGVTKVMLSVGTGVKF